MISSPVNQTLNLNDQSDPVGKLRVSEPQSLIDTDFEYSLQGTKWENVFLANNMPGPFYRANEPSYSGNQIVSIVGSVNQGVSQPLGTLRVTVATPPTVTPFAVGNFVSIKGNSTNPGLFIDNFDAFGPITAVISPTVFEVKANTNSLVSLITNVATLETVIYTGGYNQRSNIRPVSLTTVFGSNSCLLDLGSPHNFLPGMQFTLFDPVSSNQSYPGAPIYNGLFPPPITWGGGYPWIGNFVVDQVVNASTIGFKTLSAFGSNTTVSLTPTVSVFPVNNSQIIHRYADGGVQITPSLNYNNTATFSGTIIPESKIIRQTRKYFRYQSGKGVQFATGILFRPSYDLNTMPSATVVADDKGDTWAAVVVTTEQDPGVVAYANYRDGTNVRLTGLSGWGIVNSGVASPTTFTPYVLPLEGPVVRISDNSVSIGIARVPQGHILQSSVVAQRGSSGKLEILGWYDGTVRTGLFDDQNGAFFEYDGMNFNVVRRSCTLNVPSRWTATVDSGSISRTGTFNNRDYLQAGETLSIKGMTYKINKWNASGSTTTSRQITPRYRGPTATYARLAQVVEERYSQQNFNIDKLDGTGPSGYKLDLSKMQMIYIDYSWYGAGKIRYGVRNEQGNIIWFHEIKNNNVNTEAYFRSGNLPARFEISTEGARCSYLGGSSWGDNVATATTTGVLLSSFKTETDLIPPSGTLFYGNFNQGRCEALRYIKTKFNTSTNTQELSVGRRDLPTPSGYTCTAGGVVSTPVGAAEFFKFFSLNQNCAPTLSHWGTAVLMDGRFDSDTSYLFTAATLSAVVVPSNAERPVLSVRLTPSVDYGVGGFLGERNLINRSQVVLDSVGLAVIGAGQAILRTNNVTDAFNVQSNWQNVANGSISQYLDYSTRGNYVLSGGDTVGGFFLDEGAGRFAITTKEITKIRELGNSVLGGNNCYPDGPDVLTLFVRNLNNNQPLSAVARITWTEAQG